MSSLDIHMLEGNLHMPFLKIKFGNNIIQKRANTDQTRSSRILRPEFMAICLFGLDLLHLLQHIAVSS